MAIVRDESVEVSVTEYVTSERDLGLGGDSPAASFELELQAADRIASLQG